MDNYSHQLPAFFVLLVLLLQDTVVAQIWSKAPHRTCYYPPNPNYFYQPNDVPCNPNAANSNCCAPDDICLANGLCWRPDINRLHRGSCTDRTWQAPECTRICTTPGTHRYGFADVLECPGFDGRFYCGLGNASTCQTEHTFRLSNGYIADYRNATATNTIKPPATVTVAACSTLDTVTADSISASPPVVTITVPAEGSSNLTMSAISTAAQSSAETSNSTSTGHKLLVNGHVQLWSVFSVAVASVLLAIFIGA